MWPFFIFTNNNRNDFDPTPWELRRPKAYIRSGIMCLISSTLWLIMYAVLTTLATEFPNWFIPNAKFWMNITLGCASGLHFLFGIYFFFFGFFKYSKALKKIQRR